MTMKTKVKAGALHNNHNESQVRDKAPGLKITTITMAGVAVAGLKVRTNVKAGLLPAV